MKKSLIVIVAICLLFANTINCKYTISQEFSIKASLLNDRVKFELEFKDFGYVGLCFGTTMTNTDMIIAQLNQDEKFFVKDYWSVGHRKPAEDIAKGGTDDILNQSITKNGNISIITFERLLDTKDKFDTVIDIDKTMNISLAWKPQIGLSNHGKENRKPLFLFLNNKTKDFIFSDGEPVPVDPIPKIVFIMHEYFQYVAWAFLNSVGIILTRYFKHLWFSTILHAVTSGLTSAISITSGFLLISYFGLPDFDSLDFSDYNTLHKLVGLITIGVLILQALLGIASYLLIFIFEKNVISKIIRYTHKFIGYALLLATYFLLYLAFNMQFPEYTWINLTSTILFVLAIIILEFKETLFTRKLMNNKFHTKYNSLWAKLPIENDDFNRIKEKYPSRKLVIVYNFICDITDYIAYHPGGKKNLEKNINNDVTRFLIGNVNSLDLYCPFTHSDTIIEYVIEKFAIARLDLDFNPLVKVNMFLQSTNEIEFLSKEVNYANCLFNKTSSEEIYKDTYKFKFTPIENIQFLTDHIGLSQLGKHYVITSAKTGVSRMYSICFMMNHEIKDKYISLSKKLLSDEPISENDTSYLIESSYSKQLELNIKVYKDKKESFSNQIMNQNEFIINGPVGIGTNLPSTIEGTYVIYSSGTGIFCFLDLIAFTFRYINYRINGNSCLYKNEDFSNVKNSFKLKVYSAFNCRKSSIMHDFCFNLMKISNKFDLDIFTFSERISDEGHKRWDREFARNSVMAELDKISKVYLCGNPSFMNEIESHLVEFDIIKDKIVQL